jgi:Family of unknown function (DUF5330)
MRFLLRLTFWLGVIAILLPSAGSQPAPNAQFSATDAMSAAEATVGDMRQFCERQPEACTVGSQAAVVLGDRAKAGAKRIYQFFNERLAPNDSDAVTTASAASKSATTAVTSTVATAVPLPPERRSQHTLKLPDLTPAWRGPPPRKDPHDRAV